MDYLYGSVVKVSVWRSCWWIKLEESPLKNFRRRWSEIGIPWVYLAAT